MTLEQANAAIANRISTKDIAIVVVGTASKIRAPIERVVGELSDFRLIPYDAE